MTSGRTFKTIACSVIAAAALCLPAIGQTQFTAQLTANVTTVSATLANPVSYNETVTAISVSSLGALSCSGYPQITFSYKRAGVTSSLGTVVLNAGSNWSAVPLVPSLQVGDVVTAHLSTLESGCTNGLPLNVSFTSQYTANVNANLTNLAAGASGTNAFMRMKLQNCGTNNPQINGTNVVLAYQQDFTANSSGIASGIIYGNDKISCGGTQSTVYEVSFYVNQIRVGVPKLYYVCTSFPGGGCSNSSLTFDPSNATAIDPLPQPAISPFGYIYSRNIGSQTISQAPFTALSILGGFDVTQITPQAYTIAAGPLQLPTTFDPGTWVNVSDATQPGDCLVGGGTSMGQCVWNGIAWAPLGGGGGGGSANPGGAIGEPQVYGNGTVFQGTIASLDATAFTGSDPCAQINAAIVASTSTGTTVDARGFTGARACAVTLAITKPVQLLLGTSQFTLSGCPGISVTTSQTWRLQGVGWEYSYTPSETSGSVLTSGSACPLISDLTSSGPQIDNVELNGASTGTIGILSQPNGGGGFNYHNVHVHHFLYAGIVSPGAGSTFGRIMVNDNGGDGVLFGSAPIISMGSEVIRNGGNGFHFVGESSELDNPNIDLSGLNGIYYDGRIPPNWTTATTFVSPSLIRPATNNVGGNFYYNLNVNCTTGGSNPTFNQTLTSVTTDGSGGSACQWLNMGSFNNNSAPLTGNASDYVLTSPNILRSGATAASYGYAADNIRLQGDASTGSCQSNTITGGFIDMTPGLNTYNANGLHLMYCNGNTVTGLRYTGRSFANNISPADGYGFLIENSFDNVFTNLSAYDSTKSPLNLVNSSANTFSGLNAICWANSSVTGNDSYGIQLDINSNINQISNVTLDTQCSRPTEHGVLSNASIENFLDNYQILPTTAVLATLDSLGSTVLTNAHGRTAGVPIEFDGFSGEQFMIGSAPFSSNGLFVGFPSITGGVASAGWKLESNISSFIAGTSTSFGYQWNDKNDSVTQMTLDPSGSLHVLGSLTCDGTPCGSGTGGAVNAGTAGAMTIYVSPTSVGASPTVSEAAGTLTDTGSMGAQSMFTSGPGAGRYGITCGTAPAASGPGIIGLTAPASCTGGFDYLFPDLSTGADGEQLTQLSHTATSATLGFVTPAGGGNVSNSGTPTVHQTPVWVTSTTVKGVGPGTTGQVWTSGGASADPSFQNPAAAGVTTVAGDAGGLTSFSPNSGNAILVFNAAAQNCFIGGSATLPGQTPTCRVFQTADMPSSVVIKSTANTYTGGFLQDFSAVKMKLPIGSGLTETTNGQVGYDSANNNYHAAVNAADSVVATVPTATPVNAHCATWSVSGGTIQLNDSGGACPSGSVPVPAFTTSASVTMTSGTGIIGSATTMVTPGSNAAYSFSIEISETAGGSGGTCSTQGAVAVQLGYTDADSSVAIQGTPANNMVLTALNAVTGAASFTAAASPGAGTVATATPRMFRAKSGAAITYAVNQTVGSNCTTPPVITVRPVLIAMGF